MTDLLIRYLCIHVQCNCCTYIHIHVHVYMCMTWMVCLHNVHGHDIVITIPQGGTYTWWKVIYSSKRPLPIHVHVHCICWMYSWQCWYYLYCCSQPSWVAMCSSLYQTTLSLSPHWNLDILLYRLVLPTMYGLYMYMYVCIVYQIISHPRIPPYLSHNLHPCYNLLLPLSLPFLNII